MELFIYQKHQVIGMNRRENGYKYTAVASLMASQRKTE